MLLNQIIYFFIQQSSYPSLYPCDFIKLQQNSNNKT